MITTEIFSPGLPDGHLQTIGKETILKELEGCESGDLLDVVQKCFKVLNSREIDKELFKVLINKFIKEL